MSDGHRIQSPGSAMVATKIPCGDPRPLDCQKVCEAREDLRSECAARLTLNSEGQAQDQNPLPPPFWRELPYTLPEASRTAAQSSYKPCIRSPKVSTTKHVAWIRFVGRPSFRGPWTPCARGWGLPLSWWWAYGWLGFAKGAFCCMSHGFDFCRLPHLHT